MKPAFWPMSSLFLTGLAAPGLAGKRPATMPTALGTAAE